MVSDVGILPKVELFLLKKHDLEPGILLIVCETRRRLPFTNKVINKAFKNGLFFKRQFKKSLAYLEGLCHSN